METALLDRQPSTETSAIIESTFTPGFDYLAETMRMKDWENRLRGERIATCSRALGHSISLHGLVVEGPLRLHEQETVDAYVDKNVAAHTNPLDGTIVRSVVSLDPAYVDHYRYYLRSRAEGAGDTDVADLYEALEPDAVMDMYAVSLGMGLQLHL